MASQRSSSARRSISTRTSPVTAPAGSTTWTGSSPSGKARPSPTGTITTRLSSTTGTSSVARLPPARNPCLSQSCRPRYDDVHRQPAEIASGAITMSIGTVGILSPGDMGHSIGNVLHDNGLRVITCLDGRSERSRELAGKAGFEDVASLDDLVQQADIVMCVLVPARAAEVAGKVAAAMERTGATPLYVDGNAISPNTVRGIAETISAAG